MIASVQADALTTVEVSAAKQPPTSNSPRRYRSRLGRVGRERRRISIRFHPAVQWERRTLGMITTIMAHRRGALALTMTIITIRRSTEHRREVRMVITMMTPRVGVVTCHTNTIRASSMDISTSTPTSILSRAIRIHNRGLSPRLRCRRRRHVTWCPLACRRRSLHRGHRRHVPIARGSRRPIRQSTGLRCRHRTSILITGQIGTGGGSSLFYY